MNNFYQNKHSLISNFNYSVFNYFIIDNTNNYLFKNKSEYKLLVEKKY